MMPNTPIVKRDLDIARFHLADANEHLGYLAYGQVDIAEVGRAISATISAITSVSLAVERLAELPACDGSHTE